MKKIFYAIVAGLLLLASCQKAPELTITSPASIELSADGSNGTITFTANRDWTVSCSANWIHVSPSSGTASDGPITVSIRCDANTTYEDRSSTVTVKAEDLTQNITVKQPANLGIILATQAYNLTSDAKTIEVTVQANVQYTVAVTGDWIKQTGTKGLTTDKLTFSIEENTTYDAREGTITLKAKTGEVADQVISVKQAQKDALNIEKTSYDMPYDGGEIEIKVEANVDFEVTPNVDWIKNVETKALSTSTVRLKVDENGTFESREGKVEIKQQNGTLKQTITINQSGTAVDMGLSVKWATCNIGASKPEEYGDYYAWGETETKSNYSWQKYKWANGASNKLTKYCPANKTDYWDGTGSPDGKTVLDPEDDVAHVKLGGKWRMPTDAEWKALCSSDNCTWTWTAQNGVKGYLVTSKKNGNSIFFPAAGYRNVVYLRYTGSYGYYWSSSLGTGDPVSAWLVDYDSDDVYRVNFDRCYGLSVRPVLE